MGGRRVQEDLKDQRTSSSSSSSSSCPLTCPSSSSPGRQLMRGSRRGSRSAEEEAACCRFGLDFTAEASGGTSVGLNQTQNHREPTWIRARPRAY